MSVKRRSKIFAPCFLAKSRTVLASAIAAPCPSVIVQKLGERLRGVLQHPAVAARNNGKAGAPGRLLQSVALCRTEEFKASRGSWQFDCFYEGDNATLY